MVIAQLHEYGNGNSNVKRVQSESCGSFYQIESERTDRRADRKLELSQKGKKKVDGWQFWKIKCFKKPTYCMAVQLSSILFTCSLQTDQNLSIEYFRGFREIPYYPVSFPSFITTDITIKSTFFFPK